MTALVDVIPLTKDTDGVYRIAGTRVTLDLVINAFNRGATAEEIVQKFTSLELPDVYKVIGYCLKHSAEFAGYLTHDLSTIVPAMLELVKSAGSCGQLSSFPIRLR